MASRLLACARAQRGHASAAELATALATAPCRNARRSVGGNPALEFHAHSTPANSSSVQELVATAASPRPASLVIASEPCLGESISFAIVLSTMPSSYTVETSWIPLML